MELIPIIKLTLVIFSTVVFFIVLISYMIYKAKLKTQTPPWDKNSGNELRGKNNSVNHRNENVGRKGSYSGNVKNEQLYFATQRESRRIHALAHAEVRHSARFKVVNEQPVNYKIYETRAERPSTFYHPRSESVKSYAFRAPVRDILDSYSLSNEPLRKLALK